MLVIMLILLAQAKGLCQDNKNPSVKPQENRQAPTPAQKVTIKNILLKYNALKLTATDAKAIHEQFRAAGIHDGPETRECITAAGFDPEKLRTLDPPKSPDNKGRPDPPTTEEKMKMVQEKIIKPLSLNASQSETITKAFKDFFTSAGELMKTQANPQLPLEKSKIDPLEKARDEKIRQVLTKDQFTKYQELEKASRPPRPNGPEPKKN